MQNKNWIKDAIKKPGALREALGIRDGKAIPMEKLDAAIKKGGINAKRAQLAKTLRGMK